MAVVEGGLTEAAEQLVVVAAVLYDAAGRVVDADLLVLVLRAGIHEHVVLHGVEWKVLRHSLHRLRRQVRQRL